LARQLRQTLKPRGATLRAPISGSPPKRAGQGRFAVVAGERKVAAATQARLRRQLDRRAARLSAHERHQRMERADVGPAGEIMLVVAGDEGRRADP